MNKSIYQIENEYRILAENLIESGGELTPEIETQLQISKSDLQNKSVSYSFVIKQLESDISQIDVEVKRLNDLKKARSKTVERLEETLKDAMVLFDIQKIESPLVTISLRSSESVEVMHLALLPEQYKKCSTPLWSADKIKIKEAIKAGETVEGAILVKNQSLQII